MDNKYEEMDEVLIRFQDETYEAWQKSVEAKGDEWLKQFIFSRDPLDNSLIVNFRSEVCRNIINFKQYKHLKCTFCYLLLFY